MRPLIGVLCCNEIADRPVQTVASRFLDPLSRISNAAVLLVPALIDTLDGRDVALRLDGLLLTGSRSNVAPHRYGLVDADAGHLDEQRDEVAFTLAGAMIERGKPVFGICRGLQELNVLFGGTLEDVDPPAHHLGTDSVPFEALFDHRHEVELTSKGLLATRASCRRLAVNSVHRQGIETLGRGLTIEAVASNDGLIEAFTARPCGGTVLAVQWHPEWDTGRCSTNRAFFSLIGDALRGCDVEARAA